MKRFIVIEQDTLYDSLFCYEVKHIGYGDTGRTFEQIESQALYNAINRERFFGYVNSRFPLPADPPPIKLVPPTEEKEPRDLPTYVQEFLAAPATEPSGGPMAETVERVEEVSRG